MNRAGEILKVREAWRRGIYGAGTTVAVLDSGIAPHPDYRERIAAFYDVIGHNGIPYDDCGHGTHVTGILAGNGLLSAKQYAGIAPEAGIVHVKVLDSFGNGRREDVMEGIRWVLDHQRTYGIRVLNISVGTVREGDRRDLALTGAVEAAWDAGMVVVVAAGNMGPQPQTITAPGNSRKVITVGSSDEMYPVYSGRGPTKCCVCKPDVVAPGSEILSCNAKYRSRRDAYCRKSGTSMATPMVSGAVALLLSREPWLTNVEVKMRLRETARDLGLEHARQGWGLLDIPRFLKL